MGSSGDKQRQQLSTAVPHARVRAGVPTDAVQRAPPACLAAGGASALHHERPLPAYPPRADAVLLVDVDFAVSLSLAHIVQGEESYARLMRMLHSRQAWQQGWEAGVVWRAARCPLAPQRLAAVAFRTGAPEASLFLSAGMRWCCPPLRRRTTARRGGRWRWKLCARASLTSSRSSSERPGGGRPCCCRRTCRRRAHQPVLPPAFTCLCVIKCAL